MGAFWTVSAMQASDCQRPGARGSGNLGRIMETAALRRAGHKKLTRAS